MRTTLGLWPLIAGAMLAGALSSSCSSREGGGGDDPAGHDAEVIDAADSGPLTPDFRCDIALDRFLEPGPGTTLARRVEGPSDLIGGPNAHGKVGDYLIANDKIRVVLQGRDRHIGPQPYGATIIDADLVREGPGQDQFGEVGLLYNLGRTVDPEHFEVLSPGGQGQPAIVAMSGRDAVHDYLRIKNQIASQQGGLVFDPEAELPLRITNYFILNPGEQRVRFISAFCNESPDEQVVLLGDLADPGYTVEFFNGQSCTGGFGSGGKCAGLDRMSWYGYLGDGVAYGYAPYKVSTPTVPEPTNAMLTIAGVSGSIVGAAGLTGLTEWFNPDLERRSGEVRLPGGGSRLLVRDFVVGRDMGEIATIIETTRNQLTGTPSGSFSGRVTSGGIPLAEARVSLQHDGEVAAVFTTDAEGRFGGELTARTYLASAWAPGHLPSQPQELTVLRGTPAEISFDLAAPRRLTVSVRETGGAPLPAKVTVLCTTATCPAPRDRLIHFYDSGRDALPDNVQQVDFTPPTGTLTMTLPAARYLVLVSRGPEYSIFPSDFPNVQGALVDLTTGDANLQATLARVLDTTDWVSADFHVHAVDSPDSHVDNLSRVLTFVAEGVDVLVSTDHDFVTDFAPYVRQLGAEHLLATIVGEEVSTVDFGHYNIFPLVQDAEDPVTRGSIDWAGGRGPTLRVSQIFLEARARGVRTVQLNHARGLLGGLTNLRVDTDTLASHADPKLFSMAPAPDATSNDTRLISADFNALEILNGGSDDLDPAGARPLFNDWFTFLSRGLKVAGTGTSDTHKRWAAAAGYWRTFVDVGEDDAARITPLQVSGALNDLKAVATNAPFMRIQAQRVDSSGTPIAEPKGMGEVLASAGDDVLVTVTVQVPEYLDLKRVELFTHVPGDDAACPVNPLSAQAQTTRVACDGVSNLNWPQAGIAGRQEFTLKAPQDLVTVATEQGVSFRRWHKTLTFRLPAPTRDTWVLAMVHGESSLFPLVTYPRAKPFAFTNPIFIDADGAGWQPPFNPAGARAARSAAKPPPPPLRPFEAEDLQRAWKAITEAR